MHRLLQIKGLQRRVKTSFLFFQTFTSDLVSWVDVYREKIAGMFLKLELQDYF